MKCDACMIEGRMSSIRVLGHYPRTDMGSDEYFDEGGNHHYHDLNTGGGPILECSNGHRRVGSHGGSCLVDGCKFNHPSEYRWEKKA